MDRCPSMKEMSSGEVGFIDGHRRNLFVFSTPFAAKVDNGRLPVSRKIVPSVVLLARPPLSLVVASVRRLS
jgi:hypothetical protein